MTPRERFIAALERRPISGRVPHFELVFFLTMEAFGKVHPSHRAYYQWDQMEEKERRLHREDMADLYIATARRFEHDAIFLHPNPGGLEETLKLVDAVRDKSGDRFFIMIHGDATYGVPSGDEMVEFACRMADDPAGMKAETFILGGFRAETSRSLCEPWRVGWFRALRGLLLQYRAVHEPVSIQRVRDAIPHEADRGLSRARVLHDQAYGWEHNADSRSARAG